MADSSRLTRNAASGYAAYDIELISRIRKSERLADNKLERFKTEIIVNIPVVNGDASGSGVYAHARYGLLSSACSVEIWFAVIHNFVLLPLKLSYYRFLSFLLMLGSLINAKPR